ncbi:RDD family protein [Actinomadura violacea]|uniref:RDD family protein n=1 Tax=Actinomadura violacea TaxID=2819934 RepID=A0ABS3RWI5_9ACTN|nr:RDD family protein [Actinomadura violacea]MBO2460404.1 RDD family protein [Actinomadura violacea]
MSDSPNRGRPYQPSQGQGSYGPPPPYQGPAQWQQPERQGQAQPPAQQWQQQPQQPQQQWQQEQQPQQQWQEPQQDQWGQPSYESYEPAYDQYGSSSGGGDMQLAPIMRRAGARVIDNVLVAAFGFALVLPITVGAFGLGKPGSKTQDDGGIWNWPIIFTLFAVLSVLPFIYEAVQLSMWGRTFGKRFMGLGVVQARPMGNQLTTTQAVWRAAITHVGYQLGVFFFLVLAVMVWQYFAYGMLLVWAGALMAYLWAIWDQPLHQALHDRFADTLVIDERAGYGEYAE